MANANGNGNGKRKAPPAPLGEQLKAAVLARGLSAGELARMAGLDDRTVGRWLAGGRSLHLGSVERIASALGLRLR